jgi:hypothetical protein
MNILFSYYFWIVYMIIKIMSYDRLRRSTLSWIWRWVYIVCRSIISMPWRFISTNIITFLRVNRAIRNMLRTPVNIYMRRIYLSHSLLMVSSVIIITIRVEIHIFLHRNLVICWRWWIWWIRWLSRWILISF